MCWGGITRASARASIRSTKRWVLGGRASLLSAGGEGGSRRGCRFHGNVQSMECSCSFFLQGEGIPNGRLRDMMSVSGLGAGMCVISGSSASDWGVTRRSDDENSTESAVPKTLSSFGCKMRFSRCENRNKGDKCISPQFRFIFSKDCL